MEHTLEHVGDIKGNKEVLRKINQVRNHKRVFLPYELIGSSGVTLTTCGKETHERSSARCVPSGFNECISNCEVVKGNKSSIKAWRNFI